MNYFKRTRFVGLSQSKGVIIQLFFLVITMLMVLPCIHQGKLIANSDWLFHASRVEQISENIQKGQFLTFIATTTFHHTGVGSFLFYPYFFIYPWAIFKLFLNPITAFYVWYGGMIFLAFIISYFSMKAYSNNSYAAIIFSLVYVLSGYHLYLGQFVFGEFCAMAILPMVFLGFDRLFFEHSNMNKVPSWIILGSGMGLLLYAHILSVIITLEIFMVILLTYCFNNHFREIISRERIKEISKSILLFLLLTSPLVYLFCSDFIGKKISSTYFGINKALLNSLSSRLDISLDNTVGWGIGLILVVTLFIGWYFVKDNCKELWIYFLGLLLFLISTTFFPWSIFQNSFLGIIQLTYRYLSFASLFLSVTATKIIKIIFARLKINRKLGLLLLTIICLFPYMNLVGSNREVYISNKYEIRQPNNNLEKLPYSVLNSKDYYQQFKYVIPYGETDYYPNLALTKAKEKSIITQTAYINNKRKIIHSEGKPNQIIVRISDHSKKVDLPIVSYEHTFVKVNGHKVNYRISKRGTIQLTNISKNSKIEVGYKPSFIFYLTILIALITWLGLIWYAFSKYGQVNRYD